MKISDCYLQRASEQLRISQSGKAVKFVKTCDEMHEFEIKVIRKEERFIEARIKTEYISLWKRDVLQDVVENEVALRQNFVKMKEMIINDAAGIYSEEDRETLTGQVYDLGSSFELGTYGLGTFTENLYNPYLLRLEIERFMIPDIAKIVLSHVTKSEYMLAG